MVQKLGSLCATGVTMEGGDILYGALVRDGYPCEREVEMADFGADAFGQHEAKCHRASLAGRLCKSMNGSVSSFIISLFFCVICTRGDECK